MPRDAHRAEPSAGMLWMDLMVIDRGKSNNDRGTMGKLYRDNHEIRCRSEIKARLMLSTQAYTRAGQYNTVMQEWSTKDFTKLFL